METGCVVCQYIEGKLVDGMLPDYKSRTSHGRPDTRSLSRFA